MKHPKSNLLTTLLLACLSLLVAISAEAAKRPNVLWVLSEDNSIHYLKLYGDKLGSMPNVEKLASHGVTFDNAFSCAPVCSVARTTLATGIYAPRGGFQYHRKSQPANLTKGFKLWTQTLQEAGYYTSNNSKTDYNVTVSPKVAWNDSSRKSTWRNRPTKDTPFFHMQTFGTTHESSLHFKKETFKNEKTKTSPDAVKVLPYHPDTPMFRYTQARYYDKHKAVVEQIGGLVDMLKADGLLEDTFIFYFGDHGGVLPRGKGYAYESGLHVPLVVRIPENFKHLVDLKRGTRAKGFVEFVDFGPTVLNLAGIDVPKIMDGKPFLGPNISAADLNARNESFGHADRMDEKYDCVRTLRVGKYHYIRNYTGYYPDGLQNNYRYKMLAFAEWRELWNKGKLSATQSQFFKARPAEQLFDVSADPHEINNLAADPKLATVVKKLRARLNARVKKLNDLSFFPESVQIDEALGDPIAYGRKRSKEIARLADIADLACLPMDQGREKLRTALNSKRPMDRYWALTACATKGAAASSLASEARKSLNHKNLMVRLRAAEFLGRIGAEDPRPTLIGILNATKSADEALLAFQAVVLFNDFKPTYPFDMSQLQMEPFKGEAYRRVDYLKDE
jgi:arylsulfatase A-like enzyme